MRLLAIVCLAALVACGAENGDAVPEDRNGENLPRTFAEQVTLGQTSYAANCASCHGPSGEGTGAPRLVGLDRGALPLDPPATASVRTAQFKTGSDVAAFVVATMPPKAPGSLDPEEYWAILAFALHANGVDLPHLLDENTAQAVVLHE